VIRYQDHLEDISPEHLEGFFLGWPNPPSLARRLDILRGSRHVWIAREGEEVVGFVTALDDGVLCAFIPLLEVRPDRQGRGIGTELLCRMQETLADRYAVDAVCDEELVPFYERLGFRAMRAVSLRNYDRQSAA